MPASSLHLHGSMLQELEDWGRLHGLSLVHLLASAVLLLQARYTRNDAVCCGVMQGEAGAPCSQVSLSLDGGQAPALLGRNVAAALERAQPCGDAPTWLLWLGEAHGEEVNATHDEVAGPGCCVFRAVRQDAGTWELHVNCDAEFFGPGMGARLLALWVRLLKGLPAFTRLDCIPWLDPEERQQLLFAWNDTATAYPIEQCLHHLFEAQARRSPEAVAVQFGEASLTYAALDLAANAMAARLRRMGVMAGQLVPLCAERSLALVVALLAILKAGAAYVPVDPRFPVDEQALVILQSGAEVLVAQRSWSPGAAPAGARILWLDELDPDACQEYFEQTNVAQAGPADLACVMYTSGSTGQAKGTMLEHRSLVNNILWLQDVFPLDGRDRLLQKTPFTFDVSIKEFLWPLSSGACVVLAKPGGHLDMRYLTKLIQEAGITVTHLVPSMLRLFLDNPQAAQCHSLRLVMCGAEVLPPQLERRFFNLLNARLLHLYGPTEAAISVTGYFCQAGVDTGPVVPLGRPMANVQLYLLDRNGEPAPVGVPGEIHIGGVAVARGYLQRADLSATSFIADPFQPATGGRLYRTGDLARYRADGMIEFIGRADNQLKIRGARVEPAAIQSALLRHPQIQAAALAPHRDAHSEMRLIAYLVPLQGQRLDVQALRDYCAKLLPAYMVPGAFVSVDHLPLLVNGKVDYKALSLAPVGA